MKTQTLKSYQKPVIIELSTLRTENPGKVGQPSENNANSNNGPITAS